MRTPIHILQNLILSVTSLCHVLWEAYTVSHNATCEATPEKPWVTHVDAQLFKISFHPPFLWNQFTSTLCYRQTQHIYLTTRWGLVPNLMCRKRMEILQLHTEINMFCTGIFLNTKDCGEGLLSVDMVHMALDWIWNGNNFKVLEVKDLQ